MKEIFKLLPIIVSEAEIAKLHPIVQFNINNCLESEPAVDAIVCEELLYIYFIFEMSAPQLNDDRWRLRKEVGKEGVRYASWTIIFSAYFFFQSLIRIQSSLANVAMYLLDLFPIIFLTDLAVGWSAPPAQKSIIIAAIVEASELAKRGVATCAIFNKAHRYYNADMMEMSSKIIKLYLSHHPLDRTHHISLIRVLHSQSQ